MRPALTTALVGVTTSLSTTIASAQICETAELLGSSLGSNDQIGFAVAGHGDVAVVGAPFDDDMGGNAGAAYVFRYDGLQWNEEIKLLAADGAASDFYGAAVAAGDGVVMVGAPFDDDDGLSTGAVYVYRYDGAAWAFESKLVPGDADGAEEFGIAIAIDAGFAIIGAHREDLPAAGNAGAAWIYRDAGTLWTPQQKLTASDAFADDAFGRAVDIDGDAAVIGAPFNDDGGSSSGSAYVFRRLGSVWTEETRLIDAAGDFNDFFGRGAAISGDVVAIGAPGDATLAPGGSVAILRRLAGVWTPETVLPAPAGDGNFGLDVSLRTGELLIGSPGNDNNPVVGSARLYVDDKLGWIPTVVLTPSNGQLTDTFGSSVGHAGAFAIVGAPSHDGALSGAGSSYVYAVLEPADCNGNGTDDTCDIASMDSTDANGNFVPDECEPTEGDTNGDGFVDEADLGPILDNWGACPAAPDPCPGDVDGDGVVSMDDIVFIILNWTGPIMDGTGGGP